MGMWVGPRAAMSAVVITDVYGPPGTEPRLPFV